MMYNDRFSNKAEAALKLAVGMAGILGQGYVGTEHILLGLLKEAPVRRLRFWRPTGSMRSG